MAGMPGSADSNVAAPGQLSIDIPAMNGMLATLRTGRDQLDKLITTAGSLAQQPRLGANPVGHAMSTKFALRADGSGDSYAQALRSLRAQYDEAERALVTAMDRYQTIDHEGRSALLGK